MAGIYIHIPFCKTRCIYCDFYSTTLGGSRSKLFVSKLLEEAEARKSFLGSEPVKTVYIGGGTPSQLDVAELCRLIEGLSKIFDLSQIEEFSVEANPEDVTTDWVSALPLPINRVSMGVQSFVDTELQLLHRRHSAEKARQAVRLLQEAHTPNHPEGIRNISIDLMYGLPQQTLESFAYSIQEALALGTQHISAYNLQVEEGTVLFNQVEEHQLKIADDDTCNTMNELLRSRLSAAGFEQYEISNYCKPGMHSRHNSSYWDGTPYLGLGPGAHSYDGHRLRTWNEPDLLSYLDGNRKTGSETLSDTDLYNERIMLGLRTRQGVKLEHVESFINKTKLQELSTRGWLTIDATHFRLTPSGLPMADEVMRELFL